MTLTTNQYMIRQKRKPSIFGLGPSCVNVERAIYQPSRSNTTAHDVIQAQQITADLIRGYLLEPEAKSRAILQPNA
jgi:hypothetical protein